MVSQVFEKSNIFRNLFSTIRTAQSAAHIKTDLAAFKKELKKIDASIDAGQAQELHKEYQRIAGKIGDFDDREYQIILWSLSMENELLTSIMPDITARLAAAKKAHESPKDVLQDIEAVVGPLSKLKKDMNNIQSVVSDIIGKLSSLQEQLKKV